MPAFSNFPASTVRQAAGIRQPITVVLLGQSNERGRVLSDEAISGVLSRTAYPQAFKSQRNTAFRYPVYPVMSTNGSPLFRVYDDLWDAGFEPKIYNASIGSMSMVRDACGQTQARANSTGYRQYRAPSGAGDPGYAGDLMVVQGRLYLCTAGRQAYAHNPGNPAAQPTIADLDLIHVIGSQATAASEPAGLATAAVGDVIADGTIQWTCLATGGSGSTCTYNGYTHTAGVRLANMQAGFDPFNILHRAVALAWTDPTARRRIVVLQNAQSDVGNSQYQVALEAIGRYLVQRGCEVMIGLSVYQPASGTAAYDALTTAVNNALTTLRADAMVIQHGAVAAILTGANLYTLMGSTGNMASGGNYFIKDSNQDNIHVNAPGAIAMGGYMSAALLTAIGVGWGE